MADGSMTDLLMVEEIDRQSCSCGRLAECLNHGGQLCGEGNSRVQMTMDTPDTLTMMTLQ